LTGRAPYQPAEGRISPRTVLAAVLHGPPPTVASIAPQANADLVAVCEKAMAREPEARYAGMEELASDIEAWIGNRPVSAIPPAVSRALRLFVQRHKAASLTAIAGILALLASGLVFVVRVSSESRQKEGALVQSQQRGDAMAVRALLEREKDLWPATKKMLPELERWLGEVDAISRRAASYRQGLWSSSSLAAGARRELHEVIAGEKLLERRRPTVLRRAEIARTLDDATIVKPHVEWRNTVQAIANSETYSGLTILPQLGLIPLGQDPVSSLEEFWVVASGSRPTRDQSGTYRLGKGSGIVLVLLPGGTAELGSPEDVKNYRPIEQRREVCVAPFFISKYETTQSQWIQIMEDNPSKFAEESHTDTPGSLLHPVETVSATECDDFVRRLGVRLPSPGEWEYASRGGSRLAYAYGDTASALEGRENVRDRTLGSSGAMLGAPWLDRYLGTAPVGSFQANLFGIFDMIGNTSEWCDHIFHRSSPGSFSEPEAGTREFRGGNWYVDFEYSRPGYVGWALPKTANQTLGFRCARSITQAH